MITIVMDLQCGWRAAVSKAALASAQTDELGSRAVEDRFHVRDFHATILNQLGFDPNRLSYFFDGLDQRLVGVEPVAPIKQIIA